MRALINLLMLLVVSLAGGYLIASSHKRPVFAEKPVISTSTQVVDTRPNLEVYSSDDLMADNTLVGNKLQTPAEPEQTIKKLVLEKGNIYTFRGPVTEDSVMQAMMAIQKMDNNLDEGAEIMLVLDTPGGSIFDGVDFIEFLNGLDHKVNTLSLFSASMGFEFVQGLGKRYVVPNSLLMSHRGAGGLDGQFDGEFETRYKMVKQKIDRMNATAAKRMNMSVADYKKMIINEYWVHGFNAVAELAADEEVKVKCGKSLDGKESINIKFMFGITIDVVFSECPLIRAPLEVKFNMPAGQPQDNAEVKKASDLLFSDKQEFFKQYIKTEKYKEIFQ